nr:MAG TPA: hypothetical protein [Caudoviricetes sp.]
MRHAYRRLACKLVISCDTVSSGFKKTSKLMRQSHSVASDFMRHDD